MNTIQRIPIPIILLILAELLSCSPNSSTEAPAKAANEPHRPLYHFTPDSMWMNDPNGLVFYEGEYHLFYQYHPQSTVWGPMHWGHAISRDLLQWEHQPVALYPDSLGWIFSGSAVADHQNTSGLGKDGIAPLVAIFTYHNSKLEQSGSITYQYQGLAYSLDKGRSWIKYAGNPVLENPGIKDFRDPKVSWHEASKQWIMTLAVADHIRFYTSPNLISWTFASEFGKQIGAHGGVWECPDLFELPVSNNSTEKKWVLLVSINPGGPNGGSATQYFTGNFDGKTFIPETTETRWVDHGKDNYAGVTYADIPDADGRRIAIGWMSNWQYATVVPTKKWRSAMTLPRTFHLIDDEGISQLISLPVTELKQLRGKEMKLESYMIEKGEIQESAIPLAAEIQLVFELPADNIPTSFGVEIGNEKHEKIIAGYDMISEAFYLDRNESGDRSFSAEFKGKHTAPYQLKGNRTITMQLFLDVASLEFFAQEGATVMTDIFFPSMPFNQLRLFSNDGNVRLVSASIYPLQTDIK